VVGLGLSFKQSGLDLDRKIWQSAHLWPVVLGWLLSFHSSGRHPSKQL